jgi:cytochrome c biogenesis protein
VPRSVYVLDTTGMTKLTGRTTDVESIELAPGQTAQLPNGLGSVTFEDESPAGATDASQSVKRFASLQIHRDESGVWVLGFALLALGGLMIALFVPRRRVWVKATAHDGEVALEYAALARGEDPTLAAAVEDLVAGHARLLDAAGGTTARATVDDTATDDTATDDTATDHTADESAEPEAPATDTPKVD